jgi:predicted small secreted protein
MIPPDDPRSFRNAHGHWTGSELEPTRNITMRANLSITLMLLVILAATPLLGACQTTAGAGKDISAGGHALTNSAEKHAP